MENSTTDPKSNLQIDDLLKGFEIGKKPSGNVDYYGINATTSQLFVQFKKGGSYIYDNVDALILSGMVLAESLGKYIIANIVGKYTFKKYPNPLITDKILK